jgi:hypothetical protein
MQVPIVRDHDQRNHGDNLEIFKSQLQSGWYDGWRTRDESNFRWFVEEISALGIQMYVRCNPTIITANKKYNDLPEFLKNTM